MPLSWEHTHRYDSSWPSVLLAFSLRYPNPLTPHIVTVDVLSRAVDPSTARVTTERIILKRGAASALPKWFPTRVLGKTESWVYEKSVVDVGAVSATVFTRNMDHRTVMDVQEDLVIHPDPETPTTTMIDTDVVVESSFGFSFAQSRIEHFGLNRFKLSTERGRASLHTLIELLRSRTHLRNILRGQPPPLSAMLPPVMGESFSRWEQTGEGFSGHGFDDRQKERYVPEHLPPPVEPAPRTLAEWARERRAQLAESATEGMRNVRTKWFGWRLQMREIVKDEVVKEKMQQDGPDLGASGQDGLSSTQTPEDKAPPEKTRKTRSWVWEWSRNK